ncbi:twin transmembrane helix small protein [Shimia sp. R9_1]|uniref:twin transmembrane helix small protein n=1 Tax=unclassified Shimia TaxID=2630038 RepID=UPI001ADC5028|nr:MULTISPECIES: twin transmembrane helix small protein [unclassified Shimia]MBO9395937.1 twin transmembrane helix small protein [Shimia sp. R9_2]MBO9400067.1 twin transmembrane helix small protein [Shimia sp. R9_3]MBO9407951.1 twin transmembrane helix small protein [Shimia sp. R9_1]
MANDPLFWVAAVACIGVLIILMVGVGGFARGGEFNKKYANKIMRLRLIAQFVAVLLILAFVWLRQGG